MEKYVLYPATFYYWKRRLELEGAQGLEHSKHQAKELKELQKENETLKLLLAEEHLKGRLKNELLKKSIQSRREKRISGSLHVLRLKKR